MKPRWTSRIVSRFPDEELDVHEDPKYLSEAMRHLEGICTFCGHSGHQEIVCEVKHHAYPWRIEARGAQSQDIESDRKKARKRQQMTAASRRYRAKAKSL